MPNFSKYATTDEINFIYQYAVTKGSYGAALCQSLWNILFKKKNRTLLVQNSNVFSNEKASFFTLSVATMTIYIFEY